MLNKLRLHNIVIYLSYSLDICKVVYVNYNITTWERRQSQ